MDWLKNVPDITKVRPIKPTFLSIREMLADKMTVDILRTEEEKQRKAQRRMERKK